MPKQFQKATTLEELYALPGGKEWCLKNGGTAKLTFDLRRSSLSRRILQEYLASHPPRNQSDLRRLVQQQPEMAAHAEFRERRIESFAGKRMQPEATPFSEYNAGNWTAGVMTGWPIPADRAAYSPWCCDGATRSAVQQAEKAAPPGGAHAPEAHPRIGSARQGVKCEPINCVQG
jgi:hypothetical protein